MSKPDDDTWLDALAASRPPRLDESDTREIQLLRQVLLEQGFAPPEEATEETKAAKASSSDPSGFDPDLAHQRLVFRLKRKGLVTPAWFHDERVLLMAAADDSTGVSAPRILTDQGFAITPFYRLGATAGEPPTAVVIECPKGQIENYRERTAYLELGGQLIEVGPFGEDGKAQGTLPAGVKFELESFKIS